MAKEIITHYAPDGERRHVVCGWWNYSSHVSADKDAVTCMRCKRTRLYRGILPDWYTKETTRIRNLTIDQLLQETAWRLRCSQVWTSRQEAKNEILVEELRRRMPS